MNNYVKRKVAFLDLPINPNTTILKPEQVILRYGKYGTLDIGSFCYTDRSNDKRKLKNEGVLVNIASLSIKRIEYIRKIIQIISDDFSYSGSLEKSLLNRGINFLNFIKWTESNGFIDFFDSKEKSKEAFSAFVNYLKDKISRNELTSYTAISMQKTSLMFLEKFHDTDTLSIGIPLIYGQITYNTTSIPSEDTQNKILLLCESLFEGITDLILNNKPFPYKLTVPEHIGWENNAFYLFPLNSWAVNPQSYNEKQGGVWNQKEGRLNSKEDLKNLYKTNKEINRAINGAKKLLEESNSNKNHIQRIRLGIIAHHVFSIIFLATTGMNRESMLNLLWNDNYETSSERQGFRTIKHRAGNKLCNFELSIGMMPKFKKFLELRKYLLNNRDCEYLFFSLGVNFSKSPTQLSGASLRSIYSTLENIDPSIEKITSREWRAAKSDWLVRNTDVSTAALMLQNSEQVLMKHYTAGSETNHLTELSKFFSEVSNFVLDKNNKDEGEPSSVGVCSNYGNPNPLLNAPVKVNCKSPEGCLFCDKYRIHADEKDTRKLVSCRYCLQKTAQLSNNKENFDSIFGKIFQRIDGLLKEIEEINPGLTIKIIEDVEENGELDPYWARKLELLFDLGLVS